MTLVISTQNDFAASPGPLTRMCRQTDNCLKGLGFQIKGHAISLLSVLNRASFQTQCLEQGLNLQGSKSLNAVQGDQCLSLKKLLNSRLKEQRRCSLTKRYGVFGHTEEVSCIKQMKGEDLLASTAHPSINFPYVLPQPA